MDYKINYQQLQAEITATVKREFNPSSTEYKYASDYHPWFHGAYIEAWMRKIADYTPAYYFEKQDVAKELSPVVHLKGCSVYELIDVVSECLIHFGEVTFIGMEREFALWQKFEALFTKVGFKLSFNENKTEHPKFLVFKDGQLTAVAADYLTKQAHFAVPNKQGALIIEDTANPVTPDSVKCLFEFFGTGAGKAKLLLFPEGSNIPAYLDKLMPQINLIENARYANHYEYARGLEMLGKKKHFDSGQFIFVESFGIPLKPAVYNYEFYSPDNYDSVLEQLKARASFTAKAEKAGNINILFHDFYPFSRF